MIDRERLEELRADIGAEDLALVVSAFLDEADEVIAVLGAADAGRSLAAQLHFLRGSALNLGLDAMAELCLAGERLAQAGGADQVDLGHLRRIYAASRQAVMMMFQPRAAGA